MKSYKIITESFDWKTLIKGLGDEQISLLHHPNGDFILGWESESLLTLNKEKYNAVSLENFLSENQKKYIFGYLSYDIKTPETRRLGTKKEDRNFNDVHFFSAAHVLIKRGTTHLYFGEYSAQQINAFIKKMRGIEVNNHGQHHAITLNPKTTRNAYLDRIKKIKAHIQYGNIYEMNFCVNFENKFDDFHPIPTYNKLVSNSNAPFSCFVKAGEQTILSASPERYLRKKRSQLTSQPIKGTAKRGESKAEDEAIMNTLMNDQKELSENVMIVDLVRNDFSKIATKNSVNVSELCKVYSFKTVHQLISTVNCELKEKTPFTGILEATFPMGSMTGAPKISAMQIIDEFEDFSRGIYSGAIGYFDPNGNFDFNVVIRSILVDNQTKTISCSVGGAITIQSDPEKEYEECLLKLSAISKTLC